MFFPPQSESDEQYQLIDLHLIEINENLICAVSLI